MVRSLVEGDKYVEEWSEPGAPFLSSLVALNDGMSGIVGWSIEAQFKVNGPRIFLS